MEGLILAHVLRVQSIMAGKAWRQEREVSGHRASAVRETDAGLSLLFLCTLAS